MRSGRIRVKPTAGHDAMSSDIAEVSTIVVRYFAAARELVGCAEERVDLGTSGPLPLEDVAARLGERHPALRPHLGRIRFALNGDFAGPGATVRGGDELVLVPPVAGGSGAG